MKINDSLERRLLALAQPVLCNIPGAMEQFQCEAYAGGLSLELTMLYSRDPFAPASRYDRELEALIDDWVKEFRPVGNPADTAKKAGGVTLWTPEKLAELKAYRAAHTMAETVAKFGISGQRIRELLPSDKPKASPFPGVIHRLK